jgi:hypothetical protein
MFQMMIQGLLTHLRENSKHVLVCYQVSGHPHLPRITADLTQVKPGSATPDSSSGNIGCFNLKGRVKFTTGINTAVAPVSFLGRDGVVGGREVVPNLETVSVGSVKNASSDVVSNTPTTDLPVFFKLGEGFVFVFDYFKEMAVFSTARYPFNMPRPIPRTVVYSAVATGDVTIVDQDGAPAGKTIILDAAATIWFNNLPANPSPSPMPHFNIMENFFDQSGARVTVANPVPWGVCPFGSADTRPNCGTGSAAGIECSNTQWP